MLPKFTRCFETPGRYLLTDDGGLVGGGEALHDRHQEHRHVEHRGDAQRDLLPRLRGDQEHEPSQQPLSNLGTFAVKTNLLKCAILRKHSRGY